MEREATKHPIAAASGIGSLCAQGFLMFAKFMHWHLPGPIIVLIGVISIFGLVFSGSIYLRVGWDWLNNWREKNGKPRLHLDLNYILLILLLAAAGVVGWQIYRGPAKAEISQEQLDKITKPFQAQIDSLKHQLTVSNISPSDQIKKTETKKYSPAEARNMIAALTSLQEIIDKSIKPKLRYPIIDDTFELRSLRNMTLPFSMSGQRNPPTQTELVKRTLQTKLRGFKAFIDATNSIKKELDTVYESYPAVQMQEIRWFFDECRPTPKMIVDANQISQAIEYFERQETLDFGIFHVLGITAKPLDDSSKDYQRRVGSVAQKLEPEIEKLRGNL